MVTDDANLVEATAPDDSGQRPSRIQRASVASLLTIALITLACGDDDMRVDSSTGVTGVTGASGVTLGTSVGDSAPTGGQDSDSDSAGDGGTEARLDIPSFETEGMSPCGEFWDPAAQAEIFQYIWIANSAEGTVSKIDTRSGVEAGRYRVAPGESDPSRTSVNLFGDVAVADRAGGITKIAAQVERCDPLRNGQPGLQTSSGPADVRAFGDDDCVLWRTPLPGGDGPELHSAGPRPVAWEAALGADQCPADLARVWVGWFDYPQQTGHVARLNGKTGAIEDEAQIPDWGAHKSGPYGGAVNRDGDLWMLGWNTGPLVRIDHASLAVERKEIPPPPSGAKFYVYGIAVDRTGDPWLAGEQTVYHHDVVADTWDHIDISEGRMRGLQIDLAGRAFIALNKPAGLVVVDTVTRTLLNPNVALPGALMPVGISIDIDGRAWVVDRDANMAFTVNPDTYAVEMTVGGLITPYTYSDMTGYGLGLVAQQPVG
jgi:streptogramin lyase